MSNGRVELGLGAGWYEREHEAYGIEFPHSGSGSTAWRSSWRSSPACGPPGPERRSNRRAAGTRSPRRRRCPSQCSHPCRSSSAVVVRSARRPSPLASPPSSTRRSCRTSSSRPKPGACARRARRSTATATMTFLAALVMCCGSDEAEFERRAAAIGREPAELRQQRRRRHTRRGRRDTAVLGRGRRRADLPAGARPRRPRPPRPGGLRGGEHARVAHYGRGR